jgi:hypothetical protein
LAATAVDRNGLGDRHCAVTGRVEGIDLAASGGLRNCSGNVLQGAVPLHGLASSPMPETQVRVACARAALDNREATSIAADMLNGRLILRI